MRDTSKRKWTADDDDISVLTCLRAESYERYQGAYAEMKPSYLIATAALDIALSLRQLLTRKEDK